MNLKDVPGFHYAPPTTHPVSMVVNTDNFCTREDYLFYLFLCFIAIPWLLTFALAVVELVFAALKPPLLKFYHWCRTP